VRDWVDPRFVAFGVDRVVDKKLLPFPLEFPNKRVVDFYSDRFFFPGPGVDLYSGIEQTRRVDLYSGGFIFSQMACALNRGPGGDGGHPSGGRGGSPRPVAHLTAPRFPPFEWRRQRHLGFISVSFEV